MLSIWWKLSDQQNILQVEQIETMASHDTPPKDKMVKVLLYGVNISLSDTLEMFLNRNNNPLNKYKVMKVSGM